jgi:hypothetical protein
MDTIFVVGRLPGAGQQWEIQGVFTMRELADAACPDASYFVGPVPLDTILPRATQPAWPGAYFPVHPASPES